MRRLIVFYLVIMYSYSYSQSKSDDLTKYITTIKSSEKPAKQYILDLFKKYDVVVISERYHAEVTQYDLIREIISDKYFIEKVGNVFCEIGASNFQPMVDTFLLYAKYNNDTEAKNAALQIQREISFYPLWNAFVYHRFLMDLYFINKKLAQEKKIRLFISDRPFSWSNIFTKQQYNKFFDDEDTRDSIMASNIIYNYSKLNENALKPIKALVILNSLHAFSNIYWSENHMSYCAGRYLKQYFTERLANVLLNTSTLTTQVLPIQRGKWDAAFKKVGNINIGFDFKGTPFGNDQFDYITDKPNKLAYQDVFTGFVFYQPFEKQILQFGIPGIINDEFYHEIKRRLKIAGINPFFISIYKSFNQTSTKKQENIRRIKKIINQYY